MICQEMEPQVKNFVEIISKLIDLKDIKNVVDLGAADLGSSFALSRAFADAQILAFECNPRSVEKCKRNYDKYKPQNIVFFDKAVYSETKILDFYPVDLNKGSSKNDQAGSFFKFTQNYLSNAESIVQEDPVKVEAVKLKEFLLEKNISKIDIVWSDIQGAELDALKGMEDMLNDVKALHLEVEMDYNPVYLGHACEATIDSFLFEKGFEKVPYQNPNAFWVNYIYINKKYKI